MPVDGGRPGGRVVPVEGRGGGAGADADLVAEPGEAVGDPAAGLAGAAEDEDVLLVGGHDPQSTGRLARRSIAQALDFMLNRLCSPRMDALGGFLDGPRARGAFALRALMSSPWSIDVRDEAPLSVVAMVEGDGLDPVRRRRAGRRSARATSRCCAGPSPTSSPTRPTRAPLVIVLPGQHCVSPEGESLSAAMALGVRSWGNDPPGETVMLIGSYQGEGEISRRLTDALPPLVLLRAGEWDAPVLPILAAEIGRELPGQAVVLDRLLDLLVISGLRAWFGRPGARAAGLVRRARGPAGRGGRSSCCTTPRSGPGRWAGWPPRSGSPGPRWPAGSTTRSASRR